jgi:hypothetical protein
VILRDTSGTVLCTNPQFAQILAQANDTTPKPGAQRFTVEVWAPLMALALGVAVLGTWVKAGAPHALAAGSASPANDSAASPAQPSSPKRPAPASAAAKKH